MMTARQLERQHLTAGCLSQVQIDWLRGQGVSETAMIADWPINAAHVVFDGNRFDFTKPDDGGRKALTLLIEDMCRPIDIGAWQPKTGQTGLWLGMGFCLNQSDCFNPAKCSFGGCLRVHESPLKWLKAGRDGICIFDFAKCYAYLQNVPRLSFADAGTAAMVAKHLKPPKPKTQLFIEQNREAA